MAAYRTFQDTKYLDAASQIGRWIVGDLKDTSPLTDSFGGYFFGYLEGGAPNNGQSPRVLSKSKSIENNADIFAGLSQLAMAEKERGNHQNALFWTENANHAGDFVLRLYDATAGRFYAGTAPTGTRKSTGIELTGPSRPNEIINVFDFLDSQSFVTLALAGSPRYRNFTLPNSTTIDWRDPVGHMLTAFRQMVVANGQPFRGFI